jgi:kielin/chordin-like protein
MRIALRSTSLPLALLIAACADIPDPQPPSNTPPDGESMPPPDEGGDEPSEDDPGSDPSTPPPDTRQSCQVAGQTFRDGGAVPSGDSCNSCVCADGDVVCTDINCEPEACDLYLEVADGVCSRPADDPCIGQDPDCTEPEPEPEPEKLSCDAGGQTFPHGAEVPSGDSCNTCGCDDGSVSCTEIACDPVFCAEFVEEPDGVCSRFPLDPCIAQDPECVSAPEPTEPAEPIEPTES